MINEYGMDMITCEVWCSCLGGGYVVKLSFVFYSRDYYSHIGPCRTGILTSTKVLYANNILLLHVCTSMHAGFRWGVNRYGRYK
ncbi:hypothetical protein HOY82DRAFT_547832 [Tuber indicum]|nr:hypothetical protein HOY82DRAFT_547832 [Tuber indicum]